MIKVSYLLIRIYMYLYVCIVAFIFNLLQYAFIYLKCITYASLSYLICTVFHIVAFIFLNKVIHFYDILYNK